MVLAADNPFLDVFWTMLVFFLWISWIMLGPRSWSTSAPSIRGVRRDQGYSARVARIGAEK